jgi:hypothetical protein
MKQDKKQFDDAAVHRSQALKLAKWLQQALIIPAAPSQEKIGPGATEEVPSELSQASNYHPHFYHQIPDFVTALLADDPQATIHYAPLLYHLLTCPACLEAYRECYDALGYAVKGKDVHQTVNLGVRAPATIPVVTHVHFCRILISQAEAVLLQAHHDYTDEDALARSLLQSAMRISTYITQQGMRGRALQDLVRVATLFDGPQSPSTEPPATHSYSSLVGAGGGTRHGSKIMRRAETIARSGSTAKETSPIYLQEHHLEASIHQSGDTLELHLEDLDQNLRGRYLTISIPLGSLIEPVRWLGGNPRAILSTSPVKPDGSLQMPLGQTDLHLNNQDDRNLLEVIFTLLEVRAIDGA